MDDGQMHTFAGDELAPDRVDYGYATTVHRSQGATVERAHHVADGGGVELYYVAWSRARESTHVYVMADTVDQAADDLRREVRHQARDRWVTDTRRVLDNDQANAVRAR